MSETLFTIFVFIAVWAHGLILGNHLGWKRGWRERGDLEKRFVK